MILARLERHRLGTYAVTFSAGISQIVSAIILSRVAFQQMGAGELRIWFLMMALWPFISLFELGANVVLPHRFAAVHYAPDRISAVASDFFAAVLTVIGGGALLYAVAGPLATYMFDNMDILPVASALFVAAALRVCGNALQSMLYAAGDNFYDKVLRIGSTLIQTAAGIAGLKYDLGLFSLPLAWGSGALLSIALAVARQRRRWHLILGVSRVSREGTRDLLATALRYFGIAIPGQIVFNATPFIVAAMLPAVYTISYGLAQQLVAGISLLTSLPMTVAAPRLARLHHESSDAAGLALLRALRFGAIISIHCLLVVGLNQDAILSLWTGKSIHIHTIFLAVYFGMMFIEWQQSAMTTAAMATGNFKFVTVTAISALLVLTTMPFFINWWGFAGVPVAILVAQCLTCHPHNIRLALRIYRLHFRQYLRVLSLPLLSGAPVALVCSGLHLSGAPASWTLIAGACVSLVMFTGAFSFLQKNSNAGKTAPSAMSFSNSSPTYPKQENG